MKRRKRKAAFVREWPLNKRYLIRVQLTTYTGRDVIDIRVWWRDTKGNCGPTKRGVMVDVAHIFQMARALKRARRAARKPELIAKS